MSALPSVVDLEAYHGDTWSQTFRLSDGTDYIDLTGSDVTCSAIAQDGNNFGTAYPLNVVKGSNTGEVTISFTGAPMSVPVGHYAYDLQVADDEIVTWVRGTINVIPDVTP
jgi:hypothetical protein